jgi:hypothetical protein
MYQTNCMLFYLLFLLLFLFSCKIVVLKHFALYLKSPLFLSKSC